MGMILDYEVANLLKIAKFNLPVRACYVRSYNIETGGGLSEPKLLFNDKMRKAHTKNYNDERHYSDRPKFFCSAPTCDEAIEWLRSKGFIIVLTPFPAYNWHGFDWDVYHKDNGLILRGSFPVNGTYEEKQAEAIRATVEYMSSKNNTSDDD